MPETRCDHILWGHMLQKTTQRVVYSFIVFPIKVSDAQKLRLSPHSIEPELSRIFLAISAFSIANNHIWIVHTHEQLQFQSTNFLQTKLLKSWHGAHFHDLQVSRRLCADSPWTPKTLPFHVLRKDYSVAQCMMTLFFSVSFEHSHIVIKNNNKKWSDHRPLHAQGTLLFGTRRRHLW